VRFFKKKTTTIFIIRVAYKIPDRFKKNYNTLFIAHEYNLYASKIEKKELSLDQILRNKKLKKKRHKKVFGFFYLFKLICVLFVLLNKCYVHIEIVYY
jgi:hypothetical protein